MKSWNIAEGDPRQGGQVLSSFEDSRAIALRLGAGQRVADQHVHARTWIIPVSGEVEVTSPRASLERAGAGVVIELEEKERHRVVAHEDALMLILLVPSEPQRPLPARSAEQPQPYERSPGAAGDENPWSIDPLSPLP